MDKRKYPLKFGYNFSEKTAVYLSFPENYKIVFIPKTVNIRNAAGSFATSYSVKNNTAVFRSYFSVNGYKINPENYAAAKKLFNGAIKALSNQIIMFHE